MAYPVLTLLNYTEIDDADANTDWTANMDTADPDVKKEGTNSMSGILRADNDAEGVSKSSAPTSASDTHIRMWVNTVNVPYIDTEANGGYELYMNDGSTTEYYTIFSSDDYFGGWFNAVVDCNLYTTLSLASVESWGIRAQHHTNAKNAINTWIDYVRYLDGYAITGGTNSNPVTLAEISETDRGTTTLYGYGILLETSGVYLSYGKLQFGNGASNTNIEMDGEVLVFVDAPVADGLYAIDGNGSGTVITIDGSTIKSAGTQTNTRFDFDMSTGSPATATITNNVFQRGGTFTFTTGQDVTGNTFSDCETVTAGGSDMTDCSITGYEGDDDTSALIWNTGTNPDGYLDNMTFEMGTALTHAIEFGTSSATNVTLRGWTTTGYSATNNSSNSTFHVKNTSGNFNISVVGGTGNFTYQTEGANVTVTQDPVTVKVTSLTSAGIPISNTRVFAFASGTGPFPVDDTVTISNTNATATVSHSSHGMAAGDKVHIEGGTVDANKGVFGITDVSPGTYSYTMASSPGASPTGTITSTFVFLNGTTDNNGEISMTRVVPSDQGISGWARKSSASPLYQQGVIASTVDSADGLNYSTVLIADE